MELGDIPAVLEIERLSFSAPWPPEAFQHEIARNRMARYLVARSGDRVVGYAGVWLMVDDAHITTFGVHPEWRRQGIGRRILLALLALAGEMGAARMTLEVRASNLPAQALYRAHGFEVAGRRVGYYTDDGEDALVMTTPTLADESMRNLLAETRRASRSLGDANS